MFDILQVKCFGMDESQDSTRGTNDNVWTIFLQNFFVFLDGHASEENSNFYVVIVFAESLILLAYLEG